MRHRLGRLETGNGWRDPPTRYLITRRKAALRVAVPADTSPCVSADGPPGAPMFDDHPERWEFDEYARTHSQYAEEPEESVKEDSADMSDGAIADCFDTEGYERD